MELNTRHNRLRFLVLSICLVVCIASQPDALVAQQQGGKNQKSGQKQFQKKSRNQQGKQGKSTRKPGNAKKNRKQRVQSGSETKRKPSDGKLDISGLRSRPNLTVVSSGAKTGSSIKAIRKKLSDELKTALRGKLKGADPDNVCIVSSSSLPPSDREVTEKETKEVNGYSCTTFEVEESVNNSDIYILGNLNRLYPGMVLDGNELASGQYVEIQASRNPYSLTYANGPLLKGKAVAKVDNPGFDTFTLAHNQLLRQGVKGATPSAQPFEKEMIYTKEQLNLKLGANVNYASASLASEFGIDWSQEKSRILVTYKQVFYELHANRMDADSVFKDRKVLASDTYVSRVSYGRLLLFLFESEKSSTELDLAVDAAMKAGIGSASASLDLAHEKTLEQSSVKVYSQGGAASLGVLPITNGVSGINQYITEGIEFNPLTNPGSPLIFEVTYLRDGLKASVFSSTKYSYEVCTLNTGRFKVVLNSLKCTESPTFNKNAKIYGNLKVTAYQWDPGTKILIDKGLPSERMIEVDYREIDSRIVWSRSKNGALYIAKGESEPLDAPFSVEYEDWQNVNVEKSYIVISLNLSEKDTAQNDELDIAPIKIYLSDIGAAGSEGDNVQNALERSYRFSDKNNFDFVLGYTVAPN